MSQASPNPFARIARAARAVGLGAAGVLVLGGVAAAQDAPSNTSRPASIHAGSCDSPGEVVAELENLVVTFDDDGGSGGALPGSGGNDNADDADDQGGDDNADDQGNRTGILAFQNGGGNLVGADDASVVEGSEDSDIGVNLDTLIAEPHIVAVFESADAGTIIARGSIGGFLTGDDDTTLAVGLREQNGSGFAGIALFDDDDDDNDLDVDVYIGRDVASGN